MRVRVLRPRCRMASAPPLAAALALALLVANANPLHMTATAAGASIVGIETLQPIVLPAPLWRQTSRWP